jgi:trehalose/maltose transport system substrate-binding protein
VGERSLLSEAVLKEFISQTGIRINHLPAPETDSAGLALTQELLRKGDAGPDIYSIDVIWPGMLAKHFVDLTSYFPAEVLADDPGVTANYRVDGKLVAMPYHAAVGVLYYRADLLRKYGIILVMLAGSILMVWQVHLVRVRVDRRESILRLPRAEGRATSVCRG